MFCTFFGSRVFNPTNGLGPNHLGGGTGLSLAWAAAPLPTRNCSRSDSMPLVAGDWLKLRKSGGGGRGGRAKEKDNRFVIPVVGVAGGLFDTFDDSHDPRLAGRTGDSLTGELT